MEIMFVPGWLKTLLSLTTFFSGCEVHIDEPKNECNMLCCTCCDKACFHCTKSCHEGHRLIQIRKSSYHNVVRVHDIQKDLDIKDIQTYVINSFNVVFLNKRSFETKRTGKSFKHTSICRTCRKNIMNSFRFCSLGCKFACNMEGKTEDQSGSSESTTNKGEGKTKMKALSKIFRALEEDKEKKKTARKKRAKASSNSGKRKGMPCRAPLY